MAADAHPGTMAQMLRVLHDEHGGVGAVLTDAALTGAGLTDAGLTERTTARLRERLPAPTRAASATPPPPLPAGSPAPR